eukprot:scaffold111540_cov55-Attheya_sp.AAC.3
MGPRRRVRQSTRPPFHLRTGLFVPTQRNMRIKSHSVQLTKRVVRSNGRLEPAKVLIEWSTTNFDTIDWESDPRTAISKLHRCPGCAPGVVVAEGGKVV